MVCSCFLNLAGLARFIFRVVGNGGGRSGNGKAEGRPRAHKARAAERWEAAVPAAQRFILDRSGAEPLQQTNDWRSQADICKADPARTIVPRMGRDKGGFGRWTLSPVDGSLRLLPALESSGRNRLWLGGGRSAAGRERGPDGRALHQIKILRPEAHTTHLEDKIEL
ncbi:hypothetical protein OA90_23330 [Labrenzia sp. OB1]|nr:hypothetical protein OA90_23330 [Labrenzia sp. OB1]